MDAMNDIQKIRTQIEQHQAEQEQVLRRTMSVPEKELREKSYSFKEAANILGIHDSDLYDIWKNEKLGYITVDFVRRIPVDIFEKWYKKSFTIIYSKFSNYNCIIYCYICFI